jgi:hypothetical protein
VKVAVAVTWRIVARDVMTVGVKVDPDGAAATKVGEIGAVGAVALSARHRANVSVLTLKASPWQMTWVVLTRRLLVTVRRRIL